jgi:hypothetical protein
MMTTLTIDYRRDAMHRVSYTKRVTLSGKTDTPHLSIASDKEGKNRELL